MATKLTRTRLNVTLYGRTLLVLLLDGQVQNEISQSLLLVYFPIILVRTS